MRLARVKAAWAVCRSETAAENARQEQAALQEIINRDGGGFDLAAHDWAFYTERVRAARYDLDRTALRLVKIEQEAGRIRTDIDAEAFVPRAVEGLIGAAYRWCMWGDPADGAAFIRARIEAAMAEIAA